MIELAMLLGLAWAGVVLLILSMCRDGARRDQLTQARPTRRGSGRESKGDQRLVLVHDVPAQGEGAARA